MSFEKAGDQPKELQNARKRNVPSEKGIHGKDTAQVRRGKHNEGSVVNTEHETTKKDRGI